MNDETNTNEEPLVPKAREDPSKVGKKKHKFSKKDDGEKAADADKESVEAKTVSSISTSPDADGIKTSQKLASQMMKLRKREINHQKSAKPNTNPQRKVKMSQLKKKISQWKTFPMTRKKRMTIQRRSHHLNIN